MSLPEFTMSRYASSADLHAAMVAEIIRLRAALGAQAVPAGWQPIETAPVGREMFVAKAFAVGMPTYTSDPWCVWQEKFGHFVRWPHKFRPTHWMRLHAAPRADGSAT